LLRLLEQQPHPAQLDALITNRLPWPRLAGPWLQKPFGIDFLVTGPTGIGQVPPPLLPCYRSATTGHQHLGRVEDPIEYMLKGSPRTQVESGTRAMTSARPAGLYAQGTPIVLLVGETAMVKLKTAIRGRPDVDNLVADHLHCTMRRVRIGLAAGHGRWSRSLVSASLLASFAAVAAPALHEPCRRPLPDPAKKTWAISACLQQEKTITFLSGNHSPMPNSLVCPLARKGYKGRVGLYEVA